MLDFEALVRSLRDASYGEQSWHDVLRSTTEWVGGEKSGLLGNADKFYNMNLTHNHDPADQERYNAHYSKLDPRAKMASNVELHKTVTGQQLVPNERIRKSAYYADITLRADVMDSVHGLISDDIELGRRALSIQREFGNDFFGPEECARLNMLLPLYQEAMRNSLRMSRIFARGASQDPFVYALIDPGLNLHFFKGYARRLTDIMDIDPVRQRLRIRQPALAKSISGAVRKAARGQSFKLTLSDCQIALSSPPPMLDWFGWDPLAFMVISKRDDSPQVEVFADAYALTKRERQVLEQLLIQPERDLICQRLAISGETLRWHIRNLLSKTHQPNVVSLIAIVRAGDLSGIF